MFEASPVPASSPRVLVRDDLRDSFVESRPDGSVRAVHFSLRNSPRQYWTTETGAALTPTRTDRGDVHLAFYVDGPPEAAAAESTAVRAYRVVANGTALASAETAVRTGAGSLRLVLRVLGTGSIVLGAVTCVRNFRRQRRPVAQSA